MSGQEEFKVTMPGAVRVLRVFGQVVIQVDYPAETDDDTTEAEALAQVTERLEALTCGAEVDVSDLQVSEEEW